MFHYEYILPLVYSPIHGHLGCFYLWGVARRAAANTGGQVSEQASLWLCSVFQKQVTSNAQDSGLGARGYVRFGSGQGRIFLKKEVMCRPIR